MATFKSTKQVLTMVVWKQKIHKNEVKHDLLMVQSCFLHASCKAYENVGEKILF